MSDAIVDWKQRIGFSSVVRRGSLVVVSGTGPIGEDGKVHSPGDPYAQAIRCFRRIGEALAAEGSELSHVVQTRVFLADIATWQDVGRAHGEVFGTIRPATTMTGASLLDPHFLVEIDVLAWVPD